MKKIAMIVFLIALCGTAFAYDCNVFTQDQNDYFIKDENGGIVLCNWDDLNTLIQKNSELDTNNQQLAIDLNAAETAKDQYFDELLLCNAETNIYKPKAEELEGELSVCKEAKAKAEGAEQAAKEENQRLTSGIYTSIDNVDETTGETKTIASAFTVLLSDYIDMDKNQLVQTLEKCQQNYNTLSAEIGGIGILALIAVAYIVIKVLRKRLPKLKRPKSPLEKKYIELEEEHRKMKKAEKEKEEEATKEEAFSKEKAERENALKELRKKIKQTQEEIKMKPDEAKKIKDVIDELTEKEEKTKEGAETEGEE